MSFLQSGVHPAKVTQQLGQQKHRGFGEFCCRCCLHS